MAGKEGTHHSFLDVRHHGDKCELELVGVIVACEQRVESQSAHNDECSV